MVNIMIILFIVKCSLYLYRTYALYMPRPKKLRKISNAPKIKGFRAIRLDSDKEPAPIFMDYDEYEAIRLSDYVLKKQTEAARDMGISRPTFARIYESARRKLAKALSEGAPIIFQGGPVYFTSEWFLCRNCKCYFNHPDKEESSIVCPLCRSSHARQCEQDMF